MSDYKIAYYVNNNIQHFPPVQRLQEQLPGIIVVRGEAVLNHIREKYPELSERTFFIRNRLKAKRFLRKHGVRAVVYPAFQSLGFGLGIEIFHGGPTDKRYEENAFMSLYDLVCLPGEKSKDKIDKVDLLRHLQYYEIIGYPKFDPLVNRTLDYTPLFDNGNPTVLYAPTWVSLTRPGATQHRFSKYGESSLPEWGMALLKNIPENINLIVKFHVHVHDDKDSINAQMERYVEDNNLGDRIRILYDSNILEYMDQSDLMISDMSAACYEWFHFDRPIIFANPAPEHYKPESDVSSNTYAWQAGDVIYKESDIVELINKNLAEDEHKEIRNKIFHYSIYQPDGHATYRQVDAIKRLYDQHASTPYPLFLLKSWCKQFGRRLYMELSLKKKLRKRLAD